MIESELTLARILAPVAPETFLGEHFETEQLLLNRQDPEFYAFLFSFAEFDRGLHAARDTLRPVATIVPPPDSDRESRQVRGIDLSPKELYQSFAGGDTLSVGAAERIWPQLGSLSAALGDELGAVITINLYLTPAGSQGFEVHFDTHDVLVLQVDGSKDWHLYDSPCELPIEARDARQYIRQPSEQKLGGEPRLHETVRLEKGDFLYLPRGVPHKASTSDQASLHLTVGVHPLYWIDLVKAAVESVAYELPELRRALPPRMLTDPEVQSAAEERFGELTEAVSERVAESYSASLGALAQYQRNREQYPPDGHFEQLVRVDEVELDSRIRRRSGLSCEITNSGDSVGIRFPGNEVRGPMMIGPALEYISQRRRCRVRDLPALDDQSRLVLTRRLVREGLVQIERTDG